MKILPLLFLFCDVSVLVEAHVTRQLPPMRRCDNNQCPASPGPYMGVTITTDSTYRNVQTSTCPPYDNPEWTNPNMACISDTTFRIPLDPVYARVPIPMGKPYGRYNGVLYLQENPTPIFGAIGVLSTGVSVFGVGSPCGGSVPCPDGGAPTRYVDAVEAEGHTVDQCGGHASPMGEYHVHSGIGINTTSERQSCGGLPADQAGQHSQLLGWAFDGFGIYGRLSQGGILPTVLDECSGHTHEINGAMTYHYHLPDQFPWTIGCYKGCPLVSNNPRQLGVADTNATYGCPTGLSTDPNPTIEPSPTNPTVATSPTSATDPISTTMATGPTTAPTTGTVTMGPTDATTATTFTEATTTGPTSGTVTTGPTSATMAIGSTEATTGPISGTVTAGPTSATMATSSTEATTGPTSDTMATSSTEATTGPTSGTATTGPTMATSSTNPTMATGFTDDINATAGVGLLTTSLMMVIFPPLSAALLLC